MKEASLKFYILYNSNYVTFWLWQNYRDNKRFKSVLSRGLEFGRKGDEYAEHRGF